MPPQTVLCSLSSPGEGGQSSSIGGGAGGVLIDGLGPDRPDERQGEGFGGGGGGYSNGFPGAVIFDLVPDKTVKRGAGDN